MKRRQFIEITAASAGLLSMGALSGKASPFFSGFYSGDTSELEKHTIVNAQVAVLNYHWPRFVGKNGRRDDHGQEHKVTVLKIYTDKGAMGWGMSDKKEAEALFPAILNKKVSELILPGTGLRNGLSRSVDFALHDLMGIIMNKPVYQLLGNSGTVETQIYSGMIYLDELTKGNETKGTDAILENCEWDFNYGYRHLKIKIGRSGRWYPHDEGLKKDIEVVKLIYNSFKNRNIRLLVDSNDSYTLQDTIQFLEAIGDVPLFWVEEPFREEIGQGRRLRKWMDKNGFIKTFYADGEANPDYPVCMKLGKEGVMDVFLDDICGLGFTNWIKLMGELKQINMLASPHAWGDRLKTNYIAHLASGLGNVTTIEGVTCFSEDIDYGNYPIINGKIRVSEAPGFGMKLLV
jgi:D-galactarolactone cycloisomerase